MKKIIAVVLFIAMLLPSATTLSFAGNADVVPEGYTGIYDIEDLFCVRYNPDKNYILMSDIDLTEATSDGGEYDYNGNGWLPIGTTDNDCFSGIFDGNNHSIKGLCINGKTSIVNIGLFGIIKGQIRNLAMDSPTISVTSGNSFEGVVCGKLIDGGKLENITINNAELVVGTYQVSSGVLCGYAGSSVEINNILVNDLYLDASSNLGGYVGGLCGKIENATQINQVAMDNVTILSYISSTGGACGLSSGSVDFTNISISNISIDTKNSTSGGLIGDSTNAQISYCSVKDMDLKGFYSAGGQSHNITIVGGLVGSTQNAKINECFTTGKIESKSNYYYVYSPTYYASYTYYGFAYSGGLVGKTTSCEINNCYSTVNCTSLSLAQGGETRSFAGSIVGSGTGTITNCIGISNLVAYEKYGISPCSNSQNYYLYGQTTRGGTGADTSETCIALTDALLIKQNVMQYLDFDNIWFIDTSNGIQHPQLKNNPEQGHANHSYKTVVTDPTCTEKGYTTYTCVICGDTYKSDYVDALNHTEVIDKGFDATCTEAGKTDGCHCSVCGEIIKSQEVIPAKGHHYSDWIVVKESNCIEEGFAYRKCTSCGFVEIKDIDKTTTHTESDWIIDKEATPGIAGSKHKECIFCHKTLETSIIPALPHTITLNKKSVSLNYKATETISANATGKVVYTSNNPSVATVDENGNIYAAGTGNATITATIEGTDIKDTCEVNVSYTFVQWIIYVLLLGFLWY